MNSGATSNTVCFLIQFCVDVFYMLLDFGNNVVSTMGFTINDFFRSQGVDPTIVNLPWGDMTLASIILGTVVPYILFVWVIYWIIDKFTPWD